MKEVANKKSTYSSKNESKVKFLNFDEIPQRRVVGITSNQIQNSWPGEIITTTFSTDNGFVKEKNISWKKK